MKTKLTSSYVAELWESSQRQMDADYRVIDLSNWRFVTCGALIGVCALIDYIRFGLCIECQVILPKLELEGDSNIKALSINVDKSDEILRAILRHAGVTNIPRNLNDSRRIIRFISFLNNIGFIKLWPDVNFDNFESDKVDDLWIYSGSRTDAVRSQNEAYRRYTTIHRLFGSPADRSKTLASVIDEIRNKAPEAHISTPLFTDDELDKVFLSQLAENVASHALTNGYVIARTFSKEDLAQMDYPNAVLSSYSRAIQDQCLNHGFFEIIIADRGPGIFATLKDAYQSVLNNVLRQPKELDALHAPGTDHQQDVIQFSLDEFGSSYLKAGDNFKALIDRHSLNQVFQYTRKYGGSLRLISDGLCLAFDTCKEIRRGKHGLGFAGVPIKGVWPQQGLYLTITLPHNPRAIQEYPKSREIRWPGSYTIDMQWARIRLIGRELGHTPTEEQLHEKAAELIHWALEKKIDQLALDFSGSDKWATEVFLGLLADLENLFSSIHCWGINVPDSHLSILKSRWPDLDALSIPLKLFLAFPCLDKHKRLHFISKDLLPLSDGLSILLRSLRDDKGVYLPPETWSLSDLLLHLQDKCPEAAQNLDEDNLRQTLARHPHLFQCDSLGNRWGAILETVLMEKSADRILLENFSDIMRETEAYYHGTDRVPGKNQIFQLPSTGKKVDTFIWTYNLLQTGIYTDQIARFLKNALENHVFQALRGEDGLYIDAILCATAPARILAEAIAKLFRPSPPSVFDLGAINHLDPDDVTSSFEKDKVKRCLVVTDVLDTKNLVCKIIHIAQRAEAEVLAIATILRFVEGLEAPRLAELIYEDCKRPLNIAESQQAEANHHYPVVAMYDYPPPAKVDELTEEHTLYWVEPYSLRPFPVEVLEDPYYAWEIEEREKRIPQRICLLDRKQCIREGHFKKRNHHNRILINMARALQDEEISDQICEDIIDFMGDDPPAVIVTPLHSSINYLIPKLNIKLRERLFNREVICTIEMDLGGRGPRYLFPREAENILRKITTRKLLFLDDAILSGRTVETFLREFSRFIGREVRRDESFCIDEIKIYCIVNRIGRAASTRWKQTGTFCGAKFRFQEFIRFECPVHNPDDCPVCKEHQRLQDYLREGRGENRIAEWVEQESARLEAIPTVTRSHREGKVEMLSKEPFLQDYAFGDFLVIDSPKPGSSLLPKLPEGSNLKEISLQSLDGALWWFWERGYRGARPTSLLEKIKAWLDSASDLNPDHKEKLLTESLLWSLEHVSRLGLREIYEKSPDSPDYQNHIFFPLLTDLLRGGGRRIPRVLEKAGYILISHKDRNLLLSILFSIFSLGVDEIQRHDDGDAILNIILGLYLIIRRAHLKGPDVLDELKENVAGHIETLAKIPDKRQGYFINLLSFFDLEYNDLDFFNSLILLLTQIHKSNKHKILFQACERIHYNPDSYLDSLGYLIDTLPRLTFALEIVLRNDIKDNDIPIKERYDLFINYINDIKNVISKIKIAEPSMVLGWLRIADNMLSGTNSPIRKKIDSYHPSIYEVFKKVEQDEHENKSKFIKENDEVIIDPPHETGVRIIGDEWLLKETLRNHTWDVLKKHDDPAPRKIKINVSVEGEYVTISLLNNWLPHKKAADQVKSGSSFGFLNPSWKRYDGELGYPVSAEVPDFLSVMHLKLRKGFWE